MTFDLEDIIKAIRLKDYIELDVLPVRRIFAIDGIEVTQAIQYYKANRHLTNSNDQQPDNSLKLVSNKPAWVRVHLGSVFSVGSISGITGTLEVQRLEVLPSIYLSHATLSPQSPGTATAAGPTISYAARRGTHTYSLDFIVPANLMCGKLRLIARINGASGATDTMTLDIDVTLQQTLRIAGIMVGYNGPASGAPGATNVTLPAPTMADLAATSARPLALFPVQNAAVYRNAGTITWNLPLTDDASCAGCCSPNWEALNQRVQAQRVADGNRTDFLYYGLMANGIPTGPVGGCNLFGVSAGPNNDGMIMAHELGHACGLAHGPCGTPGDPNYPAYEPYDPNNTPKASIGEYGLNINDGTILPPDTFKDVMSYCFPQWISLYHYNRLINNPALHPGISCLPRNPWWRNWEEYVPVWPKQKWLPDPPPYVRVLQETGVNPQPVISIIGVVHSEDEIEIDSVMRLTAVPQVFNGERTVLTAQLIGESGRSVAHAPLYRLHSHGQGSGCGCGCEDEGSEAAYPYLFQSFVPDNEPGVALRITSGEREIWERKPSNSAPRIGGLEAYMTDEGSEGGSGLLLISPVESNSEYGIERWYQWSNDGENWYAITTGVSDEKTLIDASSLPDGTIQVRALVSDGFFTSVSDAVSVDVPRRTPDAAILAPRENASLEADRTMRLWAATSLEAEPGEDYISWLIDGEQVATGLDAFISAPEPGEHRLTLIVRGEVGETTLERTFTTYSNDNHPE